MRHTIRTQISSSTQKQISMKIKFLMVGLLGFISATTFAQKGELSSAQGNFETYEAAKSTPQIALPKLAAAKTSIDKAAVNEKTAALPQTLALKGAIYAAYAEMDTVATTSLPLFNTAAESLKKAKELDAKGEYKKLIENGNITLASYQLKKGVKEFQIHPDYSFTGNAAPLPSDSFTSNLPIPLLEIPHEFKLTLFSPISSEPPLAANPNVHRSGMLTKIGSDYYCNIYLNY